jgi:hypothetical protein
VGNIPKLNGYEEELMLSSPGEVFFYIAHQVLDFFLGLFIYMQLIGCSNSLKELKASPLTIQTRKKITLNFFYNQTNT